MFYGILDPPTGRLVYCSAGHWPQYLIRAQEGQVVQQLQATGVALGILRDVTWDQGVAQLAPGDALVLYTDGVTEAQNEHRELFGRERLLASVRAGLGRPGVQQPSTREIQDSIIADLQRFVGGAPQADDIALAILLRDSTAANR
jgi:sigma-B regulation protein RsbU (phosphoserine phosphatase)